MHNSNIRHKILTIPGLYNSGPTHWQSLWEHIFTRCERVELGCWEEPVKDEWVEKIADAIDAEPEPVLIAAHSLGCHAFAHWFAAIGANCLIPRAQIRPGSIVDSPGIAIAGYRTLVSGCDVLSGTVNYLTGCRSHRAEIAGKNIAIKTIGCNANIAARSLLRLGDNIGSSNAIPRTG